MDRFVAWIMPSEFNWAKLVIGVTVGAFFVALFFRRKKKGNETETQAADIEIIPPRKEDTLDVIDKYEELHTKNPDSYRNEAGDAATLDILEQQLFASSLGSRPNGGGTNRRKISPNNQSSSSDKSPHNLASVIRQQVQRCHTAIVHLQNRLQNETSKRQQAEEWCGMLEKELTAHLAARQTAETKCEKLNQRIRLLTRKLKLQERILRKRQKENRHSSHRENQKDIINQNNETDEHSGEQFADPSASDRNHTRDNSDSEGEEVCDEYADRQGFLVEDEEQHFASDLDEDKIAEPKELQKITEAIDEVSDDEHDQQESNEEDDESLGDLSLGSSEEDVVIGSKTEENGEFELGNDIMQQIVASTVHGDLNDLLSEIPDVSDEDSLSDIVAANITEDAQDKDTNLDENNVEELIFQNIDIGDVSSESIGDTKSTREFWEKKAVDTEESAPSVQVPLQNERLLAAVKSTSIKRGGSFRTPGEDRIKGPILKPSGKEYSREAESVHTRSMNPQIGLHECHTSSPADGAKVNIGLMREHWEKNQKRWGSSNVINVADDGKTGSDSGDSGTENTGDLFKEMTRSADFNDLKKQWIKKHSEALAQPEADTDINENCTIEKNRSNSFRALQEEWESKTQDADESL